MRRYWQAIMIALARSERLKRLMQARRGLSALATRFVGGSTAKEAVETASALAAQGIRSSLFYLGEYVNTDELVQENVKALQQAVGCLSATDLDMHVSIDPTQAGCSMGWDRGCHEIAKIGELVRKASADRSGVNCVMLDMEDYDVNLRTVALHESLRKNGIPVALTLQAYLRKTSADIDALTKTDAKVRLVKGAFAERPEIAFTKREDIKQNYRQLVDQMLSPRARDSGFYPIFGTHDDKLHDYALNQARANGWQPGEYEFEMLYGTRPNVAKALAENGERVRLYLPFGTDWWPYAVRRVGENPANISLLLRSVL